MREGLEENEVKNQEYFEAIFLYCRRYGWDLVWLVFNIFTLVTCLPLNAALLLLFFKERKSLSAAKVLGVNLVLMDILCLLLIPASISLNDLSFSLAHNYTTDNSLQSAVSRLRNLTQEHDVYFVGVINMVGCPLLLTCMCVERYLAVVRPVLYLRLRRWEYPMAASAAMWAITLLLCVCTALANDLITIIVPIALLISCLFLIMLACLCSVSLSLRDKSPAHSSRAPQKRRALLNVLVVVVPAVVSYLPVLMMLPVLSYVVSSKVPLSNAICAVVELLLVFPTLGLFIGPLFFFSMAKKMCCRGRTGTRPA